jgi:hypothetical protein
MPMRKIIGNLGILAAIPIGLIVAVAGFGLFPLPGPVAWDKSRFSGLRWHKLHITA